MPRVLEGLSGVGEGVGLTPDQEATANRISALLSRQRRQRSANGQVPSAPFDSALDDGKDGEPKNFGIIGLDTEGQQCVDYAVKLLNDQVVAYEETPQLVLA